MSKKNHIPCPVPRGNRSTSHTDKTLTDPPAETIPPTDGTGFHEEDPKRRLGGFTGEGEHALQQPGGKQGADN